MNFLDAQRKYLDELQLLGSPFKLMKESVRNEREIDHWCYGFISKSVTLGVNLSHCYDFLNSNRKYKNQIQNLKNQKFE